MKTRGLLTKRFGKIDFESAVLDFGHTKYYREEMGEGLKRRFISFSRLIRPSRLAAIKLLTNKIEQKMCAGRPGRVINIDPGCLGLAKLVLATTKDHSHRIYLSKGIYAEVTLFYRDKSFRPCEWTYPDYRTQEYADIFNEIRAIYAKQLRRP